jgi:biotin carboxylase
MRPRVAVLHHPLSFFPLDLMQQIDGYADVLWVADESASVDELRFMRRFGTLVDISGLDIDRAAKELGEHAPDGIVAFVDQRIELAAALAERLGLRYVSPAIARGLVDKTEQRAVLRAAGVPGPDFWVLPAGASRADRMAMAAQVVFPAVLKPAEGSGSKGIYHLTGPDDLIALDELEASPFASIIEEYIAGPAAPPEWYADYLSVESVVSDGHISHVALTGRFPLAEPYRETGNFIPALVADDVRAEVTKIAGDAIRALGIRDAVTHSEIKLSDTGPKLVEVNGRLGGRPPFVLRSVSETNLFQVALQLAVGEPVRFDTLAACNGVGYWRMVQPPMSATRVQRIAGIEELREFPGVESVNVRQNEVVDWREGTASWVFTARGHVASHDELAATIEHIASTVSIDYE